MSRSIRRAMIYRDHQDLSLVRRAIDVTGPRCHYRLRSRPGQKTWMMALTGTSVFDHPYGSRKMKRLAAATGLSGEPKKGSKADG